jgi:hypothetical protein
MAVLAVTAVATAEMIVAIAEEMIARSIKDEVATMETLEGAVVADTDVVAPLPGLTSRVKYATNRDTMPKIAGPDMPMMMIVATKKSMLLMGSTPTGTRIRVPHTISPVNSII